jgi:hypothetical protein
MDLREMGFWGGDWIRLAQDRDRWQAVVSAVMNLRVLAPRSYTLKYMALNKLITFTNIRILLSLFTGSKSPINAFKNKVFFMPNG